MPGVQGLAPTPPGAPHHAGPGPPDSVLRSWRAAGIPGAPRGRGGVGAIWRSLETIVPGQGQAGGPAAYLARRGSQIRAPATLTLVAAPAPGAARRPCCPPSRGRSSPSPPAAASHFLPAFPFFGRKPLPGPSARRANSSALPRPGSRSPRKSQLSSRRAPRFLIKSR